MLNGIKNKMTFYSRFIYKLIDLKRKYISFYQNIFYYFHPHIDIGKNVEFGRNVNLACIWGGKILIKDNTKIRDGVKIWTYGNNIEIGSNCTINPYCIIYGQGGTKIGDNVLIAGHCMIVSQNHLFNNHELIRDAGSTEKGILIEDNVWIAHGCSILDGLTIATGSVIAAGSVVTKSTESNSINGGVPSKLIRKY